jgi:hypothetical protein
VSEVILHIANGAGEGKVQVDCDFLVLGVDCMDAFFEAKELGCISNDGILPFRSQRARMTRWCVAVSPIR